MAHSPHDSEPVDFQARSDAFLEWFKNYAIGLSPKIALKDLRHIGCGRGVVALEDIDKDEELFSLDEASVLTPDTSRLNLNILKWAKAADEWDRLIVAIIFENFNKEKSKWGPYLDVLPVEFDTLMFWTNDELEQLRGSAVVEKIGKAAAEEAWGSTILPVMLKHGDEFPVAGANFGERVRELIRLAHVCGSQILSYGFDLENKDYVSSSSDDDDSKYFSDIEPDDAEDNPDKPRPTYKAMIPFADMFNADVDRNNVRMFQADSIVSMRTTKRVKAGEELINEYGLLPRSSLLRTYGYIADSYAPYDVVEIPAEDFAMVSANGGSVKTRGKQWNLLGEIFLLEDGYDLPRLKPTDRLESVLDGMLHMLLRSLCGGLGQPKDTEYEQSLSKMNDLIDPEASMLSIPEAALLSATCTLRLSDYPTTLDEDEHILEKLSRDHPPSILPAGVAEHRYRMAVVVRKAEKEILFSWIRLCQDFITRQTDEIAKAASKRKREEPVDADPLPKKQRADETTDTKKEEER